MGVVGPLRLAVGLIGGVLAASSTFARGDMDSAPASDIALSIAASADLPAGTGRAVTDNPAGLRSSVILRKPRDAVRRRVSVESAPSVRNSVIAGEVSPLRLKRSLTVKFPSIDASGKRIQPDGEINREGIVPASRIQTRDGAIFLEGDGEGYRGAGQVVGPPVAVPLKQ